MIHEGFQGQMPRHKKSELQFLIALIAVRYRRYPEFHRRGTVVQPLDQSTKVSSRCTVQCTKVQK
jgi:hypothetical protein